MGPIWVLSAPGGPHVGPIWTLLSGWSCGDGSSSSLGCCGQGAKLCKSIALGSYGAGLHPGLILGLLPSNERRWWLQCLSLAGRKSRIRPVQQAKDNGDHTQLCSMLFPGPFSTSPSPAISTRILRHCRVGFWSDAHLPDIPWQQGIVL